ncbi:alkaline phosphatase family protein [Mycobacterium sp. M1]|uniref:Alkaline phosphatase family protein n=1 Tax=Mycolicibacter acidiphilus TaxID=2835306 RepID=A0ABS5RQN8_9MYCO|nr:alkaline phosphatase family protein [Mycolicibacter acidiphilus]MBS9535883.1 alkaline phosphatase family protein [Mycolicibacter acidiphilus]
MTTLKRTLCGAAIAGLIAGTGAATGAPLAYLSPATLEWMLAAEHVLLIGTDGTNLDKILEYAAGDGSGFKTAMDNGITGSANEVGHTTISGQSWSTILTGVWDDKHGVINNLFTPDPYKDWPTVFNLLEHYNPDIDTSVIADWDYINGIGAAGGTGADHNVFVPFENSWADTDAQVTAETIAKILGTAANPDVSSFLFSYQVQVDEAGHGFGGGSSEYAQAVINVGANIQQILAAVHQAEQATGDDWTVIITTDHGHQQSLGFGHGFQSPNETSQFVIFDQAGEHAHDGGQNLNYSIADITPTILALFGAPMRSDFDGVSMTDPSILNSIVDPVDLQQALKDAISLIGYPNIGDDITLAIRTVFTSIPYFLDQFVTEASQYLQTIVDQDIFLVSGLAEGVQQFVKFSGGLMVGATEALAQEVAHLTGAGVIAPIDPPLLDVSTLLDASA